MKQLLSPKQVASAIGVSESSLKRWCDQGLIGTEKTPGGHRRISVGEVMRFLRTQERPLVRPEVLGLPPGSGRSTRCVESAKAALIEALEAGDDDLCRRLVIDSFLADTSMLDLCERLLRPAMHELGDGWACGRVNIYQERRACEVLSKVLYELHRFLPPIASNDPVAIGGTPPGDEYRLATAMVELVLREKGWNATSLGTSLPFRTLIAAANHHTPDLFWLSITTACDRETFEPGFADFLERTPESMRVVIGGQQVADWLARMVDDARVLHCEDFVGLCEATQAIDTKDVSGDLETAGRC